MRLVSRGAGPRFRGCADRVVVLPRLCGKTDGGRAAGQGQRRGSEVNCERSQRRAWQKMVAIGLSRPLSKAEAKQVADAWRESEKYRTSAAGYAGPWPSDFVKRWAAA